MAMGITITCIKCGERHNIYDDIQKKEGSELLVSRCPACGYITGHIINEKFAFSYNAGDGENGVEPHLDGEDNYDWDWLTYDNGSKLYNDKSGDFDQDQELVNNNLGWED